MEKLQRLEKLLREVLDDVEVMNRSKLCAWCDYLYPKVYTTKDRKKQQKQLEEHLAICDGHPMAALRKRIAELEAKI